ncbi:MAG: NAD+ synthase [Proteobacteria bacterium]|nr:NAD+ synthase [Pseudomonadota bacterium]
MRVALAQINATVGAVRGNRARLEEAYAEARAAGADLVAAPELALSGYPPRDLAERPAFVSACEEQLEVLAAITSDGGGLLVGTMEAASPDSVGKGVYNGAALLAEGRVVARFRKSLLPTYDVFDEARYFQPADPDTVVPVTFQGVRLGVTICEDVWNDADFWPHRMYDFDPAQRLVDLGVDVIVNLSASPFHLGKQDLRRRMLTTLAASAGVPVLHCNLVGGNDDLVFDGASFAVWPDGGVRGRAPAFVEALTTIDLDAPGLPEEPPMPSCAEEAAVDAITLGVRDYFAKCGFSKAVIGLSGGIDSALTAALAVRALGADAVTGITMPSRYSSDGSVDDSRDLARNLGIDVHTVAIEPVHTAMTKLLGGLWEGPTTGITDQNIQARVRGNILMAWSNRNGALVLSTGNKSELAVGYCTLYGDMAGGLAVISDLPKTFVYRVACWLNRDGEVIPEPTITKPPSAELAPDQKDTDSLPEYDVLDAILAGYLEEGRSLAELRASGVADSATVDRVVRLVDRNEYKRRQAAPGIRVTCKAFGPGRRFPVAARLEHHPFED